MSTSPIDSERMRRGIEAFIDITQIPPAETVTSEEVRTLKELLELAVRAAATGQLNDDLIVTALQLLIEDSPAGEAQIHPHEDRHTTSEDAYQNLYVILIPLRGYTYRVWFTRENDRWVLNYSKVPVGG